MPDSPQLLRAVQFYGQDHKLDETAQCKALNPLPIRCNTCAFPDFLSAPTPYQLRRGAMNAAADFSIGCHGWLLTKERLRKVIEIVAPGSCAILPTFAEKSGARTPWDLCVPLHESEANILSFKKELPVCKTCGEPMERNVNIAKEWAPALLSAHDIAALKQWNSWGRPKNEIFRQLVLSFRFAALLKKLGFKGVNPSDRIPNLTSEEQEWLDRQLVALQSAGLTDSGSTVPGNAEREWYARWLKTRKRKPPKDAPSLASLERKHDVKLPADYHAFAKATGAARFDDVEESGLEVTVLAPSKANFTEWRKGTITFEDDPDSAKVDGILIAETNCGDVFCFDLAAKGAEPPVVRYNHEMDCHEEYADSFVAFLRRLAGVDA